MSDCIIKDCERLGFWYLSLNWKGDEKLGYYLCGEHAAKSRGFINCLFDIKS